MSDERDVAPAANAPAAPATNPAASPTAPDALAPAPSATGSAPATPSASSQTPDPLTPGYVEKQELERFLTRGHQTHSTIMLLTFIGVMLFLGAMLYWHAFDYSRAPDGKWTPYVADRSGNPGLLDYSLKDQVRKDQATYQVRPGVAPRVPSWPRSLYTKLRFDIYLLGGVVFLLALIAVKIEGAKAHRRELLVLRALLRESEKQRLTIAELEKKLKDANQPKA